MTDVARCDAEERTGHAITKPMQPAKREATSSHKTRRFENLNLGGNQDK